MRFLSIASLVEVSGRALGLSSRRLVPVRGRRFQVQHGMMLKSILG